MKKIIYLILALIFVFSLQSSPLAWAQNETEAITEPPSAQVVPPTNPTGNLFQNRPKVSGPQRSSTSNAVCVKVGDAPEEDRAAACSQPAITGGAQPAPTVEAGQLVSEIKNQFGVDMQGAWNEQALRWTFNTFYKLKQTNPKFMDFINGQPVVLIGDISNSNALRNIVEIGQNTSDEGQFIGYLVHEFGHIIYHTKEGSGSFRIEGDSLYANPGPVTTYGQRHITENYPEMISYCLTKRPVKPLISEPRWLESYKPLAEKIVGPCL